MDNRNSSIAFTEDILNQVAKELNMDIGKVSNVYGVMVDYIKHVTSNTSAISLYLPHIGTLHTKVNHINRSLHKARKAEDKEKIILYMSKKDRMDRYLDEYSKSRPKRPSRHLQSIRYMMYSFRKSLSVDSVEKLQNNLEDE